MLWVAAWRGADWPGLGGGRGVRDSGGLEVSDREAGLGGGDERRHARAGVEWVLVHITTSPRSHAHWVCNTWCCSNSVP